MNSDRCYHIPTSPGQTMCACQDYRMTLELTIELMAKHIITLEQRLYRASPKVLTPLGGSDRVRLDNEESDKEGE